MNDERSDEYATEEGGGVLVVASGDATPLLETPETTLDGVAFAVAVLVEGRRPTPGRSFRLATSDLVAAFGDGVRDSAFPQVFSGARVRVRLVGQQAKRCGVVGAVRVEQRRQVGVVPACPGESSSVSGQQNVSVRVWILVLSPPRERPSAWSAGSLARFLSFDRAPCVRTGQGAGRMLVGADNRRVDRQQTFELFLSFGGCRPHRGEHPDVGAVVRPAAMPFPDRLPRAEVFGQIAPR